MRITMTRNMRAPDGTILVAGQTYDRPLNEAGQYIGCGAALDLDNAADGIPGAANISETTKAVRAAELAALGLPSRGQKFGAGWRATKGYSLANFASGPTYTFNVGGTGGGAGGSGALVTDVVFSPNTRGIRLTTNTTAGAASYVVINAPFSCAFQNTLDPIVIPVYCEQVTAGDTLNIALSSANGVTLTASVNLALAPNLTRKGWYFAVIDPASMTLAGGELLTNTFNWMRLVLTNGAGGTPAQYVIGGVFAGYQARPKILFEFDDGFLSQYTQAFRYMSKKGVRGNISVIASTVGKTAGQIDAFDYCTESQLQEIYDSGWDFTTHGYTPHTGAPLSSNQAAITADVIANRDYLISKGWTRAFDHYILPAGQWAANGITEAACAAAGMKSIRGTGGTFEVTAMDALSSVNISSQGAGEVWTLAGLQTRIDLAIKYGATIRLVGHRILGTAVDTTNETSIATFQSVVDYALAKQQAGLADIVTVSEWWR